MSSPKNPKKVWPQVEVTNESLCTEENIENKSEDKSDFYEDLEMEKFIQPVKYSADGIKTHN